MSTSRRPGASIRSSILLAVLVAGFIVGLGAPGAAEVRIGCPADASQAGSGSALTCTSARRITVGAIEQADGVFRCRPGASGEPTAADPTCTSIVLDNVAPVFFCGGQPITVDLNTGDGEITDGPDVVLGTPEDDMISAGDGDDVVCGWGGSDTLDGGAGNDQLFGGSSSGDVVDGGAGNDRLFVQLDGTAAGGPGIDIVQVVDDTQTAEESLWLREWAPVQRVGQLPTQLWIAVRGGR